MLCVVLCCAQDVISRACTTLSVAPIGRFFFGLKDMKSHCYLSPYLPVPPGNQRYQLRVFVSPAQSNFQFQMVSRSLLQYYYHQVCVSVWCVSVCVCVCCVSVSWQRVGLLGLCEGWTSDTTVMDCVNKHHPLTPSLCTPSLSHSLTPYSPISHVSL